MEGEGSANWVRRGMYVHVLYEHWDLLVTTPVVGICGSGVGMYSLFQAQHGGPQRSKTHCGLVAKSPGSCLGGRWFESTQCLVYFHFWLPLRDTLVGL